MKILIQARKDGYKVLHPNQAPEEFGYFSGDIQSASANRDKKYYGKSFYSLAFAKGGFIFTKYVFAYDTQRSYLGYVGISVFIPITRKLPGDDVKKILDELINIYYSENYIDDNKITNKRENWELFNSVLQKYNDFPNDNSFDRSIKAGSKEPAFCYYGNDNELINLFNNPYQKEYAGFTQVFFINNQLKDTANPLDVISHSGVEVNPDLKNKYYYLEKYDPSRKVNITVNGKPFSNNKGENQIRAQSLLRIEYEKDPQCYEPIEAEGTIADKKPEIYQYLTVIGNRITIKYEAFKPNPIIIPVVFKIKNKNGEDINDVEITCKNNYRPDKKTVNNRIEFIGEDLKEKWKAIAQEGDLVGKKEFTPKPDEPVEITIEERKHVLLYVSDGENDLDSFSVIVRKEGYEDKVSDFSQLSEKTKVEVKLDKKQLKFTTTNESRPIYTEIDNEDSANSRKINFQKIAKIVGLMVLFLIIVLAIWTGWNLIERYIHDPKPSFKVEQEPKNKPEVSQEQNPGDEGNQQDQEQVREEDKNTEDSEEKEENKDVQNSKSEEITIYLKTSSNFDRSIIHNYYHNVSGLSDNLNISLLLILDFVKSGYKNCDSFMKKASNDKFLSENQQLENWVQSVCKDKQSSTQRQEQPPHSMNTEIIDYIKGDGFTKVDLEQYLENPNVHKTLKSSINLCLKLWSLNGKSSNSYSSYQLELNNDTNLQNSELKNFVDNMCSTERPKYILELPAIDQRKKLSHIKGIVQ